MNPPPAIAADPKFRKYTQQVERCLATFESVHEWPDFIAFLGKLLKTLQGYMQFKEIPRKLIVSKRLAQCLNPALPTGVHQRALDVYAHILLVLGTEGLKRDLHLWSSGLFPFFEYAATAVKPTLLDLYDTHYLAIQQSLRPVAKAFILALLPGLEEENGEFFDRVLQILDRLSATVTQSFFLQNLWLCMLTSKTARAPALHYLARRLPKLTGDEDIAAIIGGDVGLLIRALSATLEDDNLLVRRSTLDLLLASLPLNGPVMHKAQINDRIILMSAATGVVLRRDSALNRRLYAWLMGPEEGGAQKQIDYLKEWAMGLLCATLKKDLDAPSPVPDARPLKVFLSLLDKWEIGSQLTDALILYTLDSIKRILSDRPTDFEDIHLAASSLYEAAEPRVVWKHLFSAVQGEIYGKDKLLVPKPIKLVRFVMTTFKNDEEMQKIHLPICFTALLELTSTIASEQQLFVSESATEELLLLLSDMLSFISPTALVHPLGEPSTDPRRPYILATGFYGIKPCRELPALSTPRKPYPMATAAEDLFAFILACVTMGGEEVNTKVLKAVVRSTRLVKDLIERVSAKQKIQVTITWSPDVWRDAVLEYVNLTNSFEAVVNVISLLIDLSKGAIIQPKISIDTRGQVGRIMNILLRYLRPQYVQYHVRAVKLIWDLEACTSSRHVEALIAESLTVRNGLPTYDAYEAFGVLWRLSDDPQFPGFKFRVPLFNVLDTMKSDDPALRRLGETWMRCSLKSYMRILDPVLYELMDPTVKRTPTTITLEGREVKQFNYEKPFDSSRVVYLLDTLVSTLKFGGQGLTKVARSTSMKKAGFVDVYKRAFALGILRGDDSYMDALISILLRLLQSEPQPSLMAMIGPANSRIQSLSIDLLQTVIARGDMDISTLEHIEGIVVAKAYACIHNGRLDLQPKLLHILHSVILASSTIPGARQGKSKADATLAVAALDLSTSSGSHVLDETAAKKLPTSTLNPLLSQTLTDGISTRTNRPILQHWLDFILTTIPQFSQSLQHLSYPLSECICRQLDEALLLLDAVASSQSENPAGQIMTDAEFVMLIHALERLILQGLSKGDMPSTDAFDETMPMSAVDKESSGLLGLMTNVFSADGAQTIPADSLSARSPAYRCLHDSVKTLYSIWVASDWTPNLGTGPKEDSVTLIYSRAKLRCRRALERLFRAQSSEVMETLVECWLEDTRLRESNGNAAFELVDLLTSSAQNAVHMLCESISMRTTPASERVRRMAVNPNVTDYVLFLFLEDYLGRLEGPIATQVWNRFVSLAKEIAANVYTYKMQILPTLRCLTTISEIVTQTSAIDDKKIRKDLQETYGKLVDTCILIAGGSFEQGNWIKIPGVNKEVNGRLTPIPRAHSDTALPEKRISTPMSEETTKATWGPELVDKINDFLVVKGISNFRRFLADTDRIATISTNLVYYIVAPAMKSRSGSTLDVDDVILEMIKEMSKVQAATRAWRGPVQEAFNDTRFFNCTLDTAMKWRPIVSALMDSDKTVFSDLLSKIASAPSANIFTNREYEILIKSLNLRRLSLVVLAGGQNKFLTQLPSIQEKLVDVLKSGAAPIVQSEVYLCMRVLLCRLSAQNLASFWPTILTELFRVIEHVFTEIPADGSDELGLLLSACKFLDLLLVLQTQEFQIQQWMFVTDTIDAVYRPEDWTPESLLDQLAEMVTDLHETKTMDGKPKVQMSTYAVEAEFSAPTTLRRPFLGFVKQIGSIKDLLPFFSQISMSSYEAIYGMGAVDWDAVEKGLMTEMFQGGVEELESTT